MTQTKMLSSQPNDIFDSRPLTDEEMQSYRLALTRGAIKTGRRLFPKEETKMFDVTKLDQRTDADRNDIIDAQIEAEMNHQSDDPIDIAIDQEIARDEWKFTPEMAEAATDAAVQAEIDRECEAESSIEDATAGDADIETGTVGDTKFTITDTTVIPNAEDPITVPTAAAQGIADKPIEEIKAEIGETVTLTNEDVESVAEVLKENADSSEEIQAVRAAIAEDHPVLEDEEGIATVNVDPETGITSITPDEGKVEAVTETRPISDKSITELTENYTATELPVLDDQLNKQFKDDMNLSDEDAAQLLNVIHRHSKGERFSKFNALPDSVKAMIRKAGGEMGITSQDQLNFFTNTMLDQFIQDANFNTAIVDFEQALQKELNIPSLVSMHAEYIKEQMEDKLIERADKLIEEGKVEQGEALKRVSAAFTDSYTFKPLYDIMENNRKVRSRLAKDVENYKRNCNDFIFKFQDTKFNIHDISLCLPILQRAFPNRTRAELVMFVNTMWHSVENLDTKVLEHNIYAYYLIKNIMALDYTDMNAKTEFDQLVMDNIEDVIDKINDYVTAKAVFDSEVRASRDAKKGGKKHG